MPTLNEWRTFYDSWAGRDPRLASTGNIVAEGEFVRLGRTLAGWLDLRGDELALDVGCASGTLTAQWAPHAKRAIGVDFSAELVADANARHDGGNITFEIAEAAALPFADATFDRVVCFNVLHSLPDHDYVQRAIAEILRVARPSATIVLGSLPDRRHQQRFFEVVRQAAPWWRRWGSWLECRLRPHRQRRTNILWFDLPALQQQLARAGWDATVHDDPPFANYRHYRKSLVLRRLDEAAR